MWVNRSRLMGRGTIRWIVVRPLRVAVLSGLFVLLLLFSQLPLRTDRTMTRPLPGDIQECLLPGVADPFLYGVPPPERLPWASDPPERLQELQALYGAYELIAAFATTLPDPVYDELANVAVAAGYLAGSVIEPGATLSLSRTIGPFTAERGYLDGPTYMSGHVVPTTGGGVCKVATTLYNVALLSGMTILERHAHSMRVPYVPPGRDAAIAWGHKDLRFKNPYRTPVLLWAEAVGATLYVAAYGSHTPPKVEWHHEELGRDPKPVVRKFNPKLPPGVERVLEGFDAVTVRTWLIITYPDGTRVRQDVGVDYYRALPEVVEYGPAE